MFNFLCGDLAGYLGTGLFLTYCVTRYDPDDPVTWWECLLWPTMFLHD